MYNHIIMDNNFINIIKEHHKTYNFCNLSKLIDKYLIPQEIEKKQNAEVSTPYKLRQNKITPTEKINGTRLFIFIHSKTMF